MAERPTIRIRAARTSDRQAVLALWRALMDEHRDIPPGFALCENADERAGEMFFDPDHAESQRLVVATKPDGAIVGFSFALLIHNAPIYDPAVIGCITDCYVAPMHRASGIGTALIAALERWFRRREITHVEVSVAANNPRAARFWRRVGAVDKFLRLEFRFDD
ncbi:MAG: GNAT family N-acetyltransferase [Myxococcales bacterium]|nr:GNAT family N-acetyltransferase [Myxococcales bacterium]